MTEYDYRPLPEDHDDAFDEMVRYAFRPEQGPPDDGPGTDDEDDEDDDEIGERRGVYDGDELLAVCRQLYWSTRVRDSEVDLAGLSAVASPPENRRQGIVGEMVRESIAEYRDRGCEFAALWPFKRSFYARYGYGTANCFATVECPVERLAFAEAYDDGEFRSADPDDWAELDAVYREHSAGEALALDRTERWWRDRVFDSFVGDPFVYGFERDGDLAGYVVYTVKEEDDETVLWASELAWTDDEAFLNLLRFAYYHDSQVDRVRLRGSTSGPLRDVIDHIPSPDYEEVEYKVWAGLMVRIVDVASALEAVSYPDGVEDRIRIAVSDDTAEWNDDTFVLDVANGTGTCEPAAPGAEPGIECSINSLSQAAVGYRPVDRLAYTGDISGEDGNLERLAALFPEDRVFLRDFF